MSDSRIIEMKRYFGGNPPQVRTIIIWNDISGVKFTVDEADGRPLDHMRAATREDWLSYKAYGEEQAEALQRIFDTHAQMMDGPAK